MKMMEAEAPAMNDGLHMPEHVWFELHDEKDACDVIARLEDGNVYTALFVTMSYLQRQMALNYAVTRQLHDTPAVRYVAMDTPHILVEHLDRVTIEDTIDNLLALDMFECYFIRVTSDNTPNPTRTNNDGELATQEVAAVVISDVLVVED